MLGGGAVIADLTNCATGACDWVTLGLDMLAVVPGMAAYRFAGQAEIASKELEAARWAAAHIPGLESNKILLEFEAKVSGRIGSNLSAASGAIGTGEHASDG